MKILFVDHSFHGKTRSSDFFVEILARHFEVERLYIDPLDHDAMQALAAVENVDLAVLWQMDFLAPILLARGVRTLVVPMYDGSAPMPDLHWLWASQARFINFSRRLHDRIQYLGGKSLLVKYYLPPVPEAERANFEGSLRVLLWQRRPEHGVNLALIERMFGAQAKSIHIHDAPDDPEVDSAPYLLRQHSGYDLTVSTWFPDRTGFQKLLAAHNVLIAPRRAEGIGMVMLEGLSRGMLVLAADAATHDEYISNWINGVLFHPNGVGTTNFDSAAALGEMAWRSVADGFPRWQSREHDIVAFVREIPKPEVASGVEVAEFGRALVRAYTGGVDSYRTYLLSNARLIERMSGRTLVGALDANGHFDPFARTTAGPQAWLRRPELPWLDQNRFGPFDVASDRFRISGGARTIDDCAWIVGQSLVLGFRFDPHLGATQRLRLRYRLPPVDGGLTYCISLNGNTLGIGEFVDADGCLECDIPPQAAKRDNQLQLQLGAAHFVFGAAEPVSLGICTLEFM